MGVARSELPAMGVAVAKTTPFALGSGRATQTH